MTGHFRAVIVLVLFTLAASSPVFGDEGSKTGSAALSIDSCPTKCFFKPGEPASIEVTISNPRPVSVSGRLTVSFKRLAHEAHVVRDVVQVRAGSTFVRAFSWFPPDEKVGYGVDVEFEAGDEFLSASTAFNVADSWRETPRYGFMCDFPRGTGDLSDARERAKVMNRYHINAVQFYDWMYRHDTLLPEHEEFVDSMGRPLSIKAVADRICAVQERGMAAMAYATVYAASKQFFEAHREWALWQGIDVPYTLGGGYLYLMNPARTSPWHARMMDEYQRVVSTMDFDGIHIDQYGYPKRAFTTPECESGSVLRVDDAFAEFTDDAKRAVTAVRPGAFVAFNCVNNWPIETIATSDADIVYIEVWPPHDTYSDIVELISEGRRLSGGKEVVLAAYLSPALEASARYLDAVIFSAGGSHIELGEGANMLADPYFPRYERVPERLASSLRGYYDFCARYADLLFGGTSGPSFFPSDDFSLVALDYPSTSSDYAAEEIWVIPRRKDGLVVANLVNLLRVADATWRIEQAPPPVLRNVRFRVCLDRPCDQILFASPEYRGGRMERVELTRVADGPENTYEFTVPYLEYWSTVVIF
ncbi:MAG: glycoside hydrolase family 66 protein [Firmicutes bacterium]|jgi:dextranase|nr:glycoside hydrolase family 66 protein [Bacillota bacterium]MDH7494419.1 glycoside hydrolase family 66 protein [Bacillota bacterium]